MTLSIFYFVGGPLPGRMAEFRRRLDAEGGPPAGWTLHPHANGDGQALHVVTCHRIEEIREHLANFDGIYACGEIVEVRALPGR
jgi:hypothetical protein